MIHPSQVRPLGAKSEYHKRQAASLERACDDAILRADRSQQWPAKVTNPRTPYDPDVVAEVFEKYTAAGWRVVQPFVRQPVLIINRPGAGSDGEHGEPFGGQQ